MMNRLTTSRQNDTRRRSTVCRPARARRLITAWLLLLAGLTVFGCSGSGPGVQTDPNDSVTGSAIRSGADTLAAARSVPPPVVPVGLDTAFVIAADSAFGVVLDSDTLDVLESEAEALEARVQAVDTLGVIARFVQGAATGDDRFALSAADSQVVGHLILRNLADDDPTAAMMLDLSTAIAKLDSYLDQASAAGAGLGWDAQDPARLAKSREVKMAVLGFSERSSELRDQLAELQRGLGTAALAADSARTQQEVSQLVSRFGADLDKAINQMGRAAQSVTAGSISPESLTGLRDVLLEHKASVLAFASQWDQFESTGSFDLANPDRRYNSQRMRDLLARMEKDLTYLANLASQRARTLASATDFQSELAARREAEDYVARTQQTLLELKERNRTLIGAYGRLAARYWQTRLDRIAQDRNEREKLYGQLEDIVARAGGLENIRADADLLQAYRRASDRLLTLRRAHLAKVAGHDRLRENVRAALASDLYGRARVLGEPDDYTAALESYQQLADEQPGQYPWLYQMASLAWSRSREAWALADDADLATRSRQQAALWLDRCEDVLLQRYHFDRDMDRTQALLEDAAGSGADAAATNPTANGTANDTAATAPADSSGGAAVAMMPGSPAARATLFLPDDRRWYYGRFVAQARVDLAALGQAAVDETVRLWLLNIDTLRKRLLFDAGDGDGFLYRYARQAMLSEDLDPDSARQVLEYWSWDEGNIVLRQRWAQVTQLPDSTTAAAAVKRDSLATLLAAAHTTDVRRQVAWAMGNTEFLKLQDYDRGLQRMHDLLEDVTQRPTRAPEVGAIDSTIVAVYPVFLYNRGTFYQQDGRRREAFYCFLGVAEQYAGDLRTAAVARYSAAALLADGNKRGALKLVRTAIAEAMRVLENDPTDFDLETLVAMYELRQTLAGDLGLFQEAVQARDEARQLRGLADHATRVPHSGGTP